MTHHQRHELWNWREPEMSSGDLTGYEVEATDGGIGKVDSTTRDAGPNGIVVDTGPWILGKKVMLPAGVVTSIDHDDGKIFVDRTKDAIKSAPEFDETRGRDDRYRDVLGEYYASTPASEWTPTRR